MIAIKGEVNGRKLNIVALSKFEIESLDRNHHYGKHIVISITCPDDEPEAKIKTDPKAILRLRFWDCEEPREDYTRVFEKKDAKSIRRFVEKHISNIDSIVVHCMAGYSRSVGTAAAISKVFLGDDKVFYQSGRPNGRVYRKLFEEFTK